MKSIILSAPEIKTLIKNKKVCIKRALEPQPPESAGKIIILELGGIRERHIIAAGNNWGIVSPFQLNDLYYTPEEWGFINCQRCENKVISDQGCKIHYLSKKERYCGMFGCFIYRINCSNYLFPLVNWYQRDEMPKYISRFILRMKKIRVKKSPKGILEWIVDLEEK